MQKKKTEKKISCLEADFKDVFVCKDNDFRPYIEVFSAKPENISQENLGTLSGILEITDDSEDSSYVVNYLISVLKKEYYSKTKRGPIESFEAALHKANLAMAKLAEHGNINWIGNFNAILAVIEKNNLHVAQTGSSKAFLLRKNTLTDLTETEDDSEIPSPLKTFIDVLSGRLEKDDKLILTSDAIFEIFSIEEIKRSALKFSKTDFVRFLRTALINELPRAAVFVVDVREKIEQVNESDNQRRPQKLNAFSQTAFAHPPRKSPERIASGTILENEEEKKNLISELQEEALKKSGEFVDKKTGHIYIKEDQFLKPEESKVSEFLENIADKTPDIISSIHDLSSSVLTKLQSLKPARKREDEVIQEDEIEEIAQPREAAQVFTSIGSEQPDIKTERRMEYGLQIENIDNVRKIDFKDHLRKFQESARAHASSLSALAEKGKTAGEKILAKTRVASSAVSGYGKKKFLEAGKGIGSQFKKRAARGNFRAGVSITERLGRKEAQEWQIPEKYAKSPSLLPDLAKIKRISASFDYAQRLYAVLAIIMLFIVPYIYIKHQNNVQKQVPENNVTEVRGVSAPLADDKNVIRIENLKSVYSGGETSNIINLNDKMFASGADSIVDLENGEKYPYPVGTQKLISFSGMDDLDLAFVLTEEGKVLSWSPVSDKFQPNNFDLPENAKIVSAKTYLTYLYVLDARSGQIYRFPRADGGFGEKTDWLKDRIDLSGALDMAVTDNIYVADAKDIYKFFQGKKQDFQLEKSATPINIDKIYAKDGFNYVYVLDKSNSRVIKLDSSGNIISQYYNPKITNANDFAVSEKNNTVYLAENDRVESFDLN